ncbi:MAG: hypothetical protein KY393_07875 [Actinobacteria bacterium]|nr:hypothetical protein [Actinomycetota bacterium]
MAASLLVLAALGCEAPDRQEGAQSAAAEVQQMLDRRAEALNSADLNSFRGPVAPEHRKVEEPVAQRILALPVKDISFELQTGTVANTFPMTGVSAELTYRFEGTPQTNTFSIPVTYGFDGPPDAPVIAEAAIDTDQLPPWFGQHTGVSSTEHFLALHRPGTEGVQQVLEVAEAARTELQRSVPADLDPVFVVVLAGDDVDYQRVTGRDLLEELPRVARAITRFSITPELYQARYRHLVVNLDRMEREGTGPQTFQHELVHLALASVTRPITPGWVSEGAAMYVANQRPNWTQRVTTGSFDTASIEELSNSSQLGGERPSGERAGLEYAYAAGAAFYLIDRFGEDAFWSFYRDFAAVPPGLIYDALPTVPQPPGEGSLAELTAGTTARLIEENFGLSFDQLDRGIRTYIAASSG